MRFQTSPLLYTLLSLSSCITATTAFSASSSSPLSPYHSTSKPCTSLKSTSTPTSTSTRSEFLQKALKTSILTTASLTTASINTANANAATSSPSPDKQYNLSNEEIAQIVSDDLTKNSFLTNGQLTRSIYDEKATFTDEIDTYTLPQWIKGTSRLFVPPPKGSRVGLVGDVVATDKDVTFNFEEDLMFNIPFKPIVFVSGKVVLDRDLESGLITSYREFWDQDVSTVLKSARFK
jgi:hypothetical protein